MILSCMLTGSREPERFYFLESMKGVRHFRTPYGSRQKSCQKRGKHLPSGYLELFHALKRGYIAARKDGAVLRCNNSFSFPCVSRPRLPDLQCRVIVSQFLSALFCAHRCENDEKCMPSSAGTLHVNAGSVFLLRNRRRLFG